MWYPRDKLFLDQRVVKMRLFFAKIIFFNFTSPPLKSTSKGFFSQKSTFLGRSHAPIFCLSILQTVCQNSFKTIDRSLVTFFSLEFAQGQCVQEPYFLGTYLCKQLKRAIMSSATVSIQGLLRQKLQGKLLFRKSHFPVHFPIGKPKA